MRTDRIREDIQRSGIIKALYIRAMWRLQKYLGFRLFVVHARELNADVPDHEMPQGCSIRMLEEAELVEFCRDPALGLSESSVRQACARGAVCFGYLDQGSLVAYKWMATGPTPAEADAGLWVRVGDGYSYSFKALTAPSHRGRHLRKVLIDFCEHWRTSQGWRYSIGYVDTRNLASIAAGRRSNNRPVGYVGYVNWFGRVVPFRTPGAKAVGFSFFLPSADERAARAP